MQSKPDSDDYLALFGRYKEDFADVYMDRRNRVCPQSASPFSHLSRASPYRRPHCKTMPRKANE